MEEMAISRTDKIAPMSFDGKSKLSLLIALSRDAELLLLDEPTLGLDVKSRHLVFLHLLERMKRENRTIIISSHQLSDLEPLTDQIAIIKDGKLFCIGGTDALLHRFTRIDALLATMPNFDGVSILERDGARFTLLWDTHRIELDELARHGVEILGETPMMLEELFIKSSVS